VAGKQVLQLINASISDKQTTHNINKAGETLTIRVLDHVIVTEKNYFSFADEGLL